MAIILIKGRTDPIRLDNKKGQFVKDRWLGNPDKSVPRAEPDDQLDLGEFWSGRYGQIKSIEMESEKRSTEEDYPELTQEQIDNRARNLARIRKEMEEKGILKPKSLINPL